MNPELASPPAPPRAIAICSFHKLGNPRLNHSPEAPHLSHHIGRPDQGSSPPNWGSRRQLLIVYSGKSSALTENHLFFVENISFSTKSYAVPETGADAISRSAIRTRGAYTCIALGSVVSFSELGLVLHGLVLLGLVLLQLGGIILRAFVSPVWRALHGIELLDPRAAT